MSGSIALSLLGGGGGAGQGDPASALLAFRRAAAQGAEEKGVAQLSKDNSVKQALSRFTEGISRAKTVEDALRDPRVMAVLLPALGLPDAVDTPGLAIRALMSDPNDPNSAASKLAAADARWKSAAATLNLAKRGMDGLRDSAVQQKLSNGYTSYQWRVSKNDEASGISDALYFQQRAATGKAFTVYEVLGDAVLRRVVTGALGLPQAIAIQSVETQARAITARIDLAKLTDSRQAKKLAEGYVMAAAGGGGGGGGQGNLLALFA
jgi:hypothetical protein